MAGPESPQPKWEGPVEGHPLESARGKLVRGFQQMQFLVRHCQAYAASEPVKLTVHFDEKSGSHIAVINGRRPPLYLGLILGEVVHDLRSALDHVAWQLALAHVGSEALAKPGVANLISFPITSSPERFEAHRARPYFSEEPLARMGSLQPYRNEPDLLHPLLWLQDLSNADKHRALRPALSQINLDDLRVRFTEGIDVSKAEILPPGDTVVGLEQPFIAIPGPRGARVEFAPVPVRVCFYTEARGQPEVMSLAEVARLVEHVSDAVHKFADLFPDVDYLERRDSWTAPDL
jgi:hypothetical protein